MSKVAVIVIGRNSSKTLDQVFRRLREVITQVTYDVSTVYVDSSSEDNSVEIALNHNIDVIQIAAGEWRCAAAGRNIGLRHIESEYVLFLDGDMVLDFNWLESAARFLDFNSTVTLVTGERVDTDFDGKEVLAVKQRVDTVEVSDRFSGACFARTEFIKSIGGFDSYLISNEEKDLCDRLIDNGGEIRILPCKMVTHLGPNIDFQERIRRGAMGYYKGIGQYTRKLLIRREYYKAFRKIRSQILFLFSWGFLLGLIVFGYIHYTLLFLSFGAGVTLYNFKDYKRSIYFILSQPLIIKGVISGLFEQQDKRTYRPKLNYFCRGDIN